MELLELLSLLPELIAHILGRSRDRSFGEQLDALAAAMKEGQVISTEFQAALHETIPGSSQPHQWKRGQVRIFPQSVIWERRRGRVHNLTGSECASERQPDWPGADRRLTLPGYQAASIRVLALRIGGKEVELAAPNQVIEVIRYDLARISSLSEPGL